MGGAIILATLFDSPEMPMSHFIADDGAKIHVKISGEGSPLVTLHGWTSSHQEWFPFLGELQKQHQVFRWDARGHGGHALGDAAAPTAERMARDLANLLDLVALGTIADVVRLDHNNRILVSQGLKRMRAGQISPGVRALFRAAGAELMGRFRKFLKGEGSL